MSLYFKNILLSLVIALYFSKGYAQDCNIPMSVIVDEGFSNLTAESSSALESQLQRLATQSNINIGWNNSHFAITAKFDQLDKYIVGSAPAKITNVYGVTFYIVDIFNQKVFNSTYIELKGVGNSETKSSLDAIKRLNNNNASLKKFLSTTKEQIISYYNSQLQIILKEARSKAALKKYDEALAMLAVVPSCCNEYDIAMSEASQIFVLYRDTYYQNQLNKAKALWASNPTVNGSRAVVAILAVIDPEAKCYNDAMVLLAEIASVVKTDIDYEVKKKYEDAVELEKLRINAIAEIGKTYAENLPKVNLMFLNGGTSGYNSFNNYASPTVVTTNGNMSGAEIFQRYGNAVFTIKVPSKDGKMYSQGSGFFINDQGIAVTNYHVLEEGELKDALIAIPGSNTAYSINEIVKANKENDFVVFSVNCTNNNFIPISNRKPNIGDKVYAIGSPKGFTNTFSSGEISQWRGSNVMQTTVMIDHGSSGGALINEAGEVVGITSGTFDAESVANLNYAMSIDVIK